MLWEAEVMVKGLMQLQGRHPLPRIRRFGEAGIGGLPEVEDASLYLFHLNEIEVYSEYETIPAKHQF
jgi:hypothetical protein